MREIHRLCQFGVGFIAQTLFVSSLLLAQQPLAWESSLENAQRLAAQNNRLVLIHFWAPWCGACKRMETEVFNQPGVGVVLHANYIPVKVNADLMPSTAKQYGVSALPTDIIITPQGQVIESLRGYMEATQLIVRLNQIAANARQPNAVQTAQVPANIPARTADPSMAARSVAKDQSMEKPALTDNRYADYFNQNPGNPSPTSAGTVPQEQLQAKPAIPSPSYAQQQPIAGPELTPPSRTQTPVSSPSPVQNLTPPLAANMPQQNLPLSNQSTPPLVANVSRQGLPGTNQISPPGTNAEQTTPPASKPSTPAPTGNPTLCMDGYCPVSLTEKQQWLVGDKRWGAIHRGRTYLFTGSEEQRRFFTDPDRYAPVISGNDVVQAMEKGLTVSGKREHGVFFGNHIFLFADEASLDKFSKNPGYYASQALEAIQASAYTAQQMR